MTAAITVDNLSKKYIIRHQSQVAYKTLRDGIADSVKRWGGKVLGPFSNCNNINHTREEFWALKDVSFSVHQGERVGIIGRNGAGKSTLLKVLSRITDPTKGRVRIRGRVASLLEVGTGFHYELTGRENIYLNGAILGMKRAEIKKKFDEIVAFAEVEKFLDTPVKHYSSGMFVRLAFSVAAHLEPDILIVDEVLAVGDAQFQKKCLGKMGDVAKEGRTVLVVSHQMDMVRSLCNKAVILDKGMIAVYGDAGEVIDSYVKALVSGEDQSCFKMPIDLKMPIQYISGRVVGQDGKTRSHFDVFDRIALELECSVNKAMECLMVSFELRRNGSTLFMSFDSDTDQDRLKLRKPGIYRYRVELPTPLLKPGLYAITLRAGIINVENCQILESVLCFSVDLISKPSTFLSYAERRLGMLAMPIPWIPESVCEFETGK